MNPMEAEQIFRWAELRQHDHLAAHNGLLDIIAHCGERATYGEIVRTIQRLLTDLHKASGITDPRDGRPIRIISAEENRVMDAIEAAAEN